jgi:hypothetical protein
MNREAGDDEMKEPKKIMNGLMMNQDSISFHHFEETRPILSVQRSGTPLAADAIHSPTQGHLKSQGLKQSTPPHDNTWGRKKQSNSHHADKNGQSQNRERSHAS